MAETKDQYLSRAVELDALAAATADSAARTAYLDMARRYREMANLLNISQMQSDEDVLRLAERMIGYLRKDREPS